MVKSFDFLKIKFSWFSILFLMGAVFLTLCDHVVYDHFFSWKIFVKMVCGFGAFLNARIFGMMMNQIIDVYIDARNERTSNRDLPSGKMSLFTAKMIAIGTAFIYLILSSFLGYICLCLAVLSLFVMTLYPYTKRITILCHFILGAVYFLAIFMVTLTLSNGYLSSSLFCLTLSYSVIVSLIIAANDIVYSVMDIHFDRKEGLFSIPAVLGKSKALNIVRLCLMFASLIYFLLVWLADLSLLHYFIACIPLGFIIYDVSHLKNGFLVKESVFFWSNIRLAGCFCVSNFLFFILKMKDVFL